jgi:hypothetical protein
MKSETYVYALRNCTIKKQGDQFFSYNTNSSHGTLG